MSDDNKTIKVLTPEFRVSFPAVFKPKAAFEGNDPTYNIQMLFQKSTDISVLKQAAKKAAKKKFPDGVPKGFRWPWRDGDEKNLDNYKGTIFISAKSKMAPGIVDAKKEEITILDQDKFYAGCWARATLTAYTYDFAGNKGVAFGLQNLQKLRDDEAFSGRANAKDDFDAVEVCEDDWGSDDDFK